MDSLTLITTILAIIAALAAAIIGVVVWFGDRTNRSRISFLWVSIFVCVWIITNVLFTIAVNPSQYIIVLVSYAAAMFTVVQIFAFCLGLVRQHSPRLSHMLIIAVGYGVAIISAVPGLISGGVSNNIIQTHPPALATYGAFLLFYIVSSCVVLVRGLHGSDSILRHRIRLVLYGIAGAGFVGVTCNLILPLLNIYSFIQLGPAGAAVLVGAVAYSIVKYSLFDVRLAIVRTAAYTMSILFLGLVYTLTIYLVFGSLLGQQMGILQGILGFGLGFLFPRVKRFFDRVTNAIFYRDNYDTDVFYSRLNDRLTVTTDLHHLLEIIAREIATTLKAEQAHFFIYAENGHHVTAGTGHHQPLPVADVKAIQQALGTANKVVVTDLLASEDPLRRLLISHKIAVALPLNKQDMLIGFLFLNNPLTSNYTRRDIHVLETIADELVIAIQNALSIKEVKDVNAHLEQRIDSATKELRASNAQLRRLDEAKDEFVSMASHQLRTPLTSIKGYISMVREGDVGKITEAQDQMLSQAFASSERMVHLINDFLNVSRLQTGKFMIDKRPVNLAKVIEQELDSLVANARSRNLEFSYTPPKNFPVLNLDEDKMRQVIMNFSDNAIYYSTEGTTVKVKLAVEGKDVVFTVTDAGIGVPAAQQASLFNKFFRATNARLQRPDGTGVGLFLAKKVIDAHNGTVIFASKEGKGSTFGFRLPLAAAKVEATTSPGEQSQ